MAILFPIMFIATPFPVMCSCMTFAEAGSSAPLKPEKGNRHVRLSPSQARPAAWIILPFEATVSS